MHATKANQKIPSPAQLFFLPLPCAVARDLGFLLLVKDVVGVEAALVELIDRIRAIVIALN